MNFVVVGASAGLGRALCEESARRGHNVLLVASDSRDLAPMAASLQLEHGVRAEWLACRFGDEEMIENDLAAAVSGFGPIDGVFYPIGFSRDDDNGFLDEAETLRLMRINFLGPASLTTALWPGMLKRERAYVVGFGSVAAIRGRSRNVVYAAAKRALASYFESLRHLAAGGNIRVHFYQLGFVDTPRIHSMKLPLPKASAGHLARLVLDRLDQDSGPVIYPMFWIPVSAALRWMPWFLYKGLRF